MGAENLFFVLANMFHNIITNILVCQLEFSLFIVKYQLPRMDLCLYGKII